MATPSPPSSSASVASGDETLQRIKTSGDNNEYIHIGNQKYLRSELSSAFGGDFRPGLYVPPSRKLGNPTPMGLASFSMTTLFLSMLNVRIRGVTEPIMITSVAYTFGGFVQFLAAMWELAVENTWGAVALGSYGTFWMSYSILLTGAFGVAEAYTEEELNQALGMFLWCWFIFTFLMMVTTIRSTVPFFLLLFFLDVTLLLLAISKLTGNDAVGLAGGWTGIVVGILGFYNMFAGLANYENCYFDIPALFMPTAQKVNVKHHSD